MLIILPKKKMNLLKKRIRDKSGKKTKYYTIKKVQDKDSVKWVCNCGYYKNKGKKCKHIWQVIMKTEKWNFI